MEEMKKYFKNQLANQNENEKDVPNIWLNLKAGELINALIKVVHVHHISPCMMESFPSALIFKVAESRPRVDARKTIKWRSLDTS